MILPRGKTYPYETWKDAVKKVVLMLLAIATIDALVIGMMYLLVAALRHQWFNPFVGG